MNKNALKAAHLLKHYMKMLAQKSGTHWDSDNDAEIDELIEAILDAAGDYTDEAIDDHNNAQISHKL
jgi:hypothetical protein